MVRVLTVSDMTLLLKKVSLKTFFLKLIDQLELDFARWKEFHVSPRHATHVPQGVIELMPICDHQFYSFKYVNGHPKNPQQGKPTVLATGQLSLVATGDPVLISEMTLLTAIRTAATSALASKYLAKKNTRHFGIIGTGAQSEFQTLAHHFALGIQDIFYFDTDPEAMAKFKHHLSAFPVKLHTCPDGRAVVEQADLITTSTARSGHHHIIQNGWVKQGLHINGIGGDSPGKTEIDPALLNRCETVVELLEQTRIEGEIQQQPQKGVSELWTLCAGMTQVRSSDAQVTLFDSVGFALEDYSALRLVYQLAEEHQVGHLLDLIPDLSNPKDLFSICK